MADEHHDLEFENTDAGASTTFPMAAGNVKKNGFLVIKGRACKVRLNANLLSRWAEFARQTRAQIP